MHPWRACVVAFLLIAQPLAAQTLTAPPDAKARIDKHFERFNGRPGCAVGAAIDGAPVFASGYGVADLEHNIPITAETVFEPGSVSKQFTAAAVLLLAQQGKLSLDDPIRKYIPEVPDYGTPVTIRHLIHHTSGLRDWGSVAAIGGWPRGMVARSHDDVLEIVSHQRALNYVPGAEYSYTNTGYNLAVILVSRVAGKSFAEFTRETIFAPLDMSSSSWRDDFRRIVPNRAIAYSPSGTSFALNMPFENVHGNGGMLTTVGDLLRWNTNFTDPRVGGQALVDSQLRRAVLSDGRPNDYAAGLVVGTWRGVREISHSGSTAGYGGWLARYPDQGLSVAILCNVSSANPTQLGRDVAALYLGNALPRAPAPPEAVDVKGLQELSGLYRNLRTHSTVVASVANGRLLFGGAPYTPVSQDMFVSGDSRLVVADGRLRVNDGLLFEKVEPASPGAAALQSYVGEYSSDEAQATLRVAVQGERLMVLNRPGNWTPLVPTYRDAFSGLAGAVRFLRDASGRIAELSVSQERVWDLRFKKRTTALSDTASRIDVSVTVAARAMQPGELVVLSLKTSVPVDEVRVRAFERDLTAFRKGPSEWAVAIGIDLDTKPGRHDVSIVAGPSETNQIAHPLTVVRKTFATRQLKVDAGFVNPPADVTARISDEATRLNGLWSSSSATPLWSGPFARPVPDASNSAFGTRSVYNGEPRSPHGGADFSSAAGTPVKSPNGGRVVLAGDLYFTGNTVVIDHGGGLFSLFAHLRAITVRESEAVTTGAVIGEVGATGRVTGPHLHWAVRANGARVDPISLLAVLGR